ncbi:MAG: peptidoglycan-binding protein [Oscillatoriales cyanobacterium]|nr:MAG: peptidoglycan-binding protein [Oscillatoriales cyanobacterium]
MESWAYLHGAIAAESSDPLPLSGWDWPRWGDQTAGSAAIGVMVLGALLAPGLTPAAVAYDSLRFGDRGLAVQNLQQLLRGAGMIAPTTAEFDSATELALRNYQRRTGKLAITGLLDRTTALMLMTANGAPIKQVPQPFLVRGDQGPSVQILQWRLRQASILNIPLLTTGTFDEATRSSLMSFQSQHRLPATGVLDLATQAKLDAETVEPQRQSWQPGRGTNDAVGNRNDRGWLPVNYPNDSRWQPVSDLPRSSQPRVVRPSDRPSTRSNRSTGGYGALVAPIYPGETSDRVATLQGKLRTLGFQRSRTNTGHFGDVTQKSLVAFQRSRRLPATGYVDAATANALATVPVSGKRGFPYVGIKQHRRWTRSSSRRRWVQPVYQSAAYNPCCVRIYCCGPSYGADGYPGWR